MKKLNIINLICVGVALALEIIPFGIQMKWADFFFEKYTYHSYFDLTVWGYGDMGPFICGILTSVVFAMLIARLFFKPHKSYNLAMCVLSVAGATFSVIPSFFGSYTLIGLIITILLGVSTEISALMFMNKENK